MKAVITERLKKERLIFDGGTGSVLVDMGLGAGVAPETLNFTDPDIIEELHYRYITAGADIINSNTFGVNCLRYDDYDEYIRRAMDIAKRAVERSGRQDVYISFDIGPLGQMLSPLGRMKFEDAVEVFAKNVRVAKECGADLVLVETMSDMYETKAAVLAVKENCDLPLFVTNAYGGDGKLLTGADPESMAAMLEGMGVDAIGLNCSRGPKEMLPIIHTLSECLSVPMIVKPNAGMPTVIGDKTVYDIGAEEFAEIMKQIAPMASVMGGCCGTTPEYIKALKKSVEKIEYKYPEAKSRCVISSYTHSVVIGDRPLIVGERINPTGKPKFKDALREGSLSYALTEASEQSDRGADILDVNVGLAGIDETDMLPRCVREIQAICDTPLQIDSGNTEAMSRALRLYNGKALINSVNGSAESMNSIFPLMKKYGGVVIALTMDEDGIPESADGRVRIAQKIYDRAREFGIEKNSIVFDPLAMTIASNSNSARITLDTMKELKKRGFYTSLGVSNISFGLPERDAVNTSFFTAALWQGLKLAIINPHSVSMMNTYRAYLALSGMDEGCREYVDKVISPLSAEKPQVSVNQISLKDAIIKGLRDEVKRLTAELLIGSEPLSVISEHIVPALDRVGDDFERGRAFLPNLLMSAECANISFELIKEKFPKDSADDGVRVCLATVKGDIHDIGKNIVKLLMESHGFSVLDLGRDVDGERILEGAKSFGAQVVVLSALMTTTLPAMASTVELIKRELPNVKVMVGGAVLTQEYADHIGADFYAKDAMEAVRCVKELAE